MIRVNNVFVSNIRGLWVMVDVKSEKLSASERFSYAMRALSDAKAEFNEAYREVLEAVDAVLCAQQRTETDTSEQRSRDYDRPPLRDSDAPLLPQLKAGDKVKLVLADYQHRELPCGVPLTVVDTSVSVNNVALAYGAIERWVPNDGRVQPWLEPEPAAPAFKVGDAVKVKAGSAGAHSWWPYGKALKVEYVYGSGEWLTAREGNTAWQFKVSEVEPWS